VENSEKPLNQWGLLASSPI